MACGKIMKTVRRQSTLNIIFTKDNVFQRPLYCKKYILYLYRTACNWFAWIWSESRFKIGAEYRYTVFFIHVWFMLMIKEITNIIFFWLDLVLNTNKMSVMSFSYTIFNHNYFPTTSLIWLCWSKNIDVYVIFKNIKWIYMEILC